jgi:hypothetical protein
VPLHFRTAIPTRASASNIKRPWSWVRLAARAALLGVAASGMKRKCLENLFPQPPRVAVHRVPNPRLHRLIHRFPVDEPRVVVRLKPAEPPPESDHVGPRQPCVGREQPKAKEREPVATPMNAALTGMQCEAKAVEKLADLAMHFVELLLAVGKEEKVVNVARIRAGAEITDDHVVHRVQIDVSEELGRLVAERQPPAAFVRGEKRIAGEVVQHFLLRVGTRDDEFDETERLGTVDHAGQQVSQNLMVDGRKVPLEQQVLAQATAEGAVYAILTTEQQTKFTTLRLAGLFGGPGGPGGQGGPGHGPGGPH